MKTPLALHNLWHQGAKSAVSVGGVAFALLLVFMQLGFMGAVSHTAASVFKNLDFDIVIRARDYLHLYEPGQIDRKWILVAKNTEGVSSAYPFWTTVTNWRSMPNAEQAKESSFPAKYLSIAVMAFEPGKEIFTLDEVQDQTSKLLDAEAILLDDSTQADYGPWNGRRFTDLDLNRQTEVGEHQFAIRGLFELGTGFSANGALITSDSGFSRILPIDIRNITSMALVKSEDASPVGVEDTLERIRARTLIDPKQDKDRPSPTIYSTIKQWLGAPPEIGNAGAVDVLSRSEALAREQYRWLWQTPIGLIFQLGVVLSLLVGAAIVYMVLSTDVANRLPEYATLMAMGYSRKYLASIVMTQALILFGLGFIAAWGVAEILYFLTYLFSSIPMSMTTNRVILVAVLGALMCCTSGLLALRKLWKAEPASLF